MAIEAHIIYPIAVIGILRAPSLLPIIKEQKALLKLGLAVGLCVLVLATAFVPVYHTLKDAFPQPIQRITQPEVDLANWMREQPADTSFYLIGPVTLTKQKWIRVLSLRETHTAFNQYQLDDSWKNYDYVIFDYTDLAILAQAGQGAQQGGMLQQDEHATFNESQLAYQNAAILVYHAAN